MTREELNLRLSVLATPHVKPGMIATMEIRHDDGCPMCFDGDDCTCEPTAWLCLSGGRRITLLIDGKRPH